MSAWINAAEQPPDADMTVLISISDPAANEPVWLGYLDGDQWRTVEGEAVEVIAWQLLPEPCAELSEVPAAAPRGWDAIEGGGELQAADAGPGEPRPHRLIVIGCGKQKLDHAAPAGALYTGPLFRARKAHAEASGCPWVIASALHGLLDPASVIEPYDVTLAKKSKREREGWGERFLVSLRRRVRELGWEARDTVVEIHAGADYFEAIPHPLDCCLKFEEPTAGLGIGQQLALYSREAKQQQPDLLDGGAFSLLP